MDCVAFEDRLTAWLEGGIEFAQRESTLRALRRHAADCAACRRSIDLLDWAELPPGERDPAAPPPDARYWEEFNDRLLARVGRERHRARRRWLALAASVALLLVGWWVVSRLRPGAAAPSSTIAPETLPLEAGLTAEEDPLLDDVILALFDEEAEETDDDRTVEDWTDEDWAADPQGASWFPETERLDTETRRKLLRWLDEQNEDYGGETS